MKKKLQYKVIAIFGKHAVPQKRKGVYYIVKFLISISADEISAYLNVCIIFHSAYLHSLFISEAVVYKSFNPLNTSIEVVSLKITPGTGNYQW